MLILGTVLIINYREKNHIYFLNLSCRKNMSTLLGWFQVLTKTSASGKNYKRFDTVFALFRSWSSLFCLNYCFIRRLRPAVPARENHWRNNPGHWLDGRELGWSQIGSDLSKSANYFRLTWLQFGCSDDSTGFNQPPTTQPTQPSTVVTRFVSIQFFFMSC